MPLFKYRAVDQAGEALEGTMEEESAVRVTAILRERGAQVNEVTLVSEPPARTRLKRKLSWQDLALLNDQLLAVTRSGLPFAPALKALAHDVASRRFREVLRLIQADLQRGLSLEESLRRHPGDFPPLYISLVAAGERSGNLSGVLEMLNSHSARILDLRNKLYTAATYPAITSIIASGVLLFLLIKVVPIFDDAFSGMRVRLPGPTQVLIAASRFLQGVHAWHLLTALVILIAAVTTFIVFRWHPAVQAPVDRFKERLFIFGPTYRSVTLARFSKALGLLLRSGLPITESLDLAGAACGNEAMRKRVQAATLRIAQGERVADAFQDAGGFPHGYTWLLANGEARGELEDTLFRLSESHAAIAENHEDYTIRLVEPALTLLIGAAIAFVVLALYLPIFKIGDAI